MNKLRAATGVHWHGIEVASYSDGVPDFSGQGGRLAPPIAPGDSFVAVFTPPAAAPSSTTRSNETFQINPGLYGGLLVTDSGTYHADRERLIIFGANGPAGAHATGDTAPGN